MKQFFLFQVYVVDDNRQVVMVMGKKPIEIENQIEEITR